MLRDIDKRDFEVVILQSPSEKLKMYVRDKYKSKYKITQDSLIEVNTTKDIKKVKEVLGLMPPFSDCWLVTVNLEKVSLKDLSGIINQSSTCVFLCTSEKYRTFKDFKERVKKLNSCLDLYITYLRRPDFVYLYDALVPEENRMSKALFDYFVQSYSGDIESVFDLFIAMNGGTKIEKRKDIADICGIGGLTIESFIFSLLKDAPTTEKGLKKVMQNRIKAGLELSEVYNFDTLYNFMSNSLNNLVQIKLLKDTGVIYKTIRNLPDGYEQSKLARYQKYMYSLSEIPLSRFLRLADCMGKNRWRSNSDFLNFVYRYYLRYLTDGTVNLKEVKKNVVS